MLTHMLTYPAILARELLLMIRSKNNHHDHEEKFHDGYLQAKRRAVIG